MISCSNDSKTSGNVRHHFSTVMGLYSTATIIINTYYCQPLYLTLASFRQFLFTTLQRDVKHPINQYFGCKFQYRISMQCILINIMSVGANISSTFYFRVVTCRQYAVCETEAVVEYRKSECLIYTN